MRVNEKTWMKFADEKIKLDGCRIWVNNCGNSDRLQEYVFEKQLHIIDKYVDGSSCAMVRVGCLPVSGITRMSWKYNGEHYVCDSFHMDKDGEL